ncbi:hypothetical protein TRVA0_016S01134 [Trichomonascus vanleenenianus]|uniref:uncharacterized protein n=1 Tax=Trichomonascus vanleenenianus TaxID=2268995 RepID=UPI003ECB43DE
MMKMSAVVDDFEDIYLDERASRNSSTSTSSASDSLDEEYETDATSTTNSIIDPHKLNGYALNSLKSQSCSNGLASRRESMPEYVKRRDSLPDNYKHTSLPASANSIPRQHDLSSGAAKILSRHRSVGMLRRTADGAAGAAHAAAIASRASDIALNSNPDFSLTRHASAGGSRGTLRKAVSTSRLPSMRVPHTRSSSGKLTRKQIEQQFDNDGDDIDDSCIWNVPLSPALYAQQQQAGLKKNHPVARLGGRPPINNTNTSSMKNTPITPRSGLHHKGLSAIKEIEVVDSVLRSSPSKIVAGGIEGLGEDAEALTRQFQVLNGDIEGPHRRSSNPLPSSSIAPSMAPKRRITTDPIVNQPQATVVSRTRPTYLPPKSAQEERKHREEYQRLVQQVALADKKREEQKKLELEARRKQEAKDEAEWRDRVLPHFDTVCKDAKTRELWWRGVPARFRSTVWKRRIGNRLQITPQVYDECVAKPCNCIEQMSRDASSTLPELKIFDRECGPLHADLVTVLRAYAAYQPLIGYRKGMNSIAAMFLLNMPKYEAFVAMANLLDDAPLVRAVYLGDEQTSNNYYYSFLKVLNAKLPNLYKHLGEVRLSPEAYLEPMIRSMFCGLLSIDVTSRVWDIMIFEGDGVLLRTALGVLTAMECRLYGDRAELLKELEAPRVDKDENSFMLAVRQAFKAT